MSGLREDKPRIRSESGLTADDLRMVRSIEGLYGPPRWTQDEWLGEPRTTRSAPVRTARQPLRSLALRTLLAVIAAAVCWYAVPGGASLVQSTVSFALKATGLVRETPPSLTAEYLVAMQTLGIGEVLSPTDPRVPQLKALLDEISPKCRENRFELAAALIAAHDALVMYGVDQSAVSILVQANTTLSDQTRRPWPTSCTDVINRIVAAQIPAR